MNPALLFKFALAALLTIWPAAVPSPHYPGPKFDAPPMPITQQAADVELLAYCYSGPSAPSERRVCRIAREVSAVVSEHAALGRIPFEGPAAQQATALALLEIAWHESGFRQKVETCVINGDPPFHGAPPSMGLAVSLFQLQANSRDDLFLTDGTKNIRAKRYSREAVCKSNALAARLALHALIRQPWKAQGSAIPGSVRGMFFTYAAGKGVKSKAGMEHVEKFEAMLREQRIAFVPAKGAMWVDAKP